MIFTSEQENVGLMAKGEHFVVDCPQTQDGHKEHPVEMAASPRRQGANAPSEILPGSIAPGGQPAHYQSAGGGAGGGMHPLSSVAAGTLGDRLAPHSSPATGLRSMVVQSDFRKVFYIFIHLDISTG